MHEGPFCMPFDKYYSHSRQLYVGDDLVDDISKKLPSNFEKLWLDAKRSTDAELSTMR